MKALALILSLIFAAPAYSAWNTAGGVSSAAYVNIADNAVLDHPDSDWTFAFMWLLNATPASDGSLFANNGGLTGNPAFHVYCLASTDALRAANNSDTTQDQSFPTTIAECLTTGVWRRIIVQHSGNVMSIYVDNVLGGTDTATVGASSGPAGGLFMGARPTAINGINSAFCDIAQWSRLLTADERAALNTWSASKLPQSRQFFIPAVREFIEWQVPLTITNSGATVVDCPRLFR